MKSTRSLSNRVVLQLAIAIAAIGIQQPTLAQQAPNTIETLNNAIKAWKLHRAETKRVHLKTHGTVAILKDSESYMDNDGTTRDFPSKDIEYESRDEFLIDFENGKYRHEMRTFALYVPTEKLNPIVKIDILDAIERKIYSANPERALGRVASDVSIRAINVRDSDVIQIGLEPTLYCFGYLMRAQIDGKRWDRDPSPQDFGVFGSAPLRVRQIAGSRSRNSRVEFTFLNDQRYRIAQIKWVDDEMTTRDLNIEYHKDTGLPRSWKMTSYGAGRVLRHQTFVVDQCKVNDAISADVFSIQIKAGMALKNDQGFFRVQADGKSLTPITPIEVAWGSDKTPPK